MTARTDRTDRIDATTRGQAGRVRPPSRKAPGEPRTTSERQAATLRCMAGTRSVEEAETVAEPAVERKARRIETGERSAATSEPVSATEAQARRLGYGSH